MVSTHPFHRVDDRIGNIRNYKILHVRQIRMGGVITLIVGVLALTANVPSLFCIWSNMVLTSLFLFGQTCSRKEVFNNLLGNRLILAISTALLIFGIINEIQIGCQFWSIEAISVWHPLLFLSGICVTSAISEAIMHLKIGKYIAYIGDYSFSIMALHFLAFKIVTIIHHHFDIAVPLNSFPTSDIDLNYWSTAYFVLGIAFPILCTKLYTIIKDFTYSNIKFVLPYKRLY